jgi:hypothetical protein
VLWSDRDDTLDAASCLTTISLLLTDCIDRRVTVVGVDSELIRDVVSGCVCRRSVTASRAVPLTIASCIAMDDGAACCASRSCRRAVMYGG